ncbi:hypothetical protein BGX24_002121 [Mortierella sp. AD032]|nr:hypothetical protein BGX24_002121 [Mortierella sp. AD032]
MADNILTLLCLVDGETTTNAFPVEIQSTKSIGILKDLIMAKKTSHWDDILAHELILWHVSIPVASASKKHKPIDLDDIISPTELDSADTISDVFPPPDKPPTETIHIIVQQPLHVYSLCAGTCSSLYSIAGVTETTEGSM